jgi:hypothetical protein
LKVAITITHFTPLTDLTYQALSSPSPGFRSSFVYAFPAVPTPVAQPHGAHIADLLHITPNSTTSKIKCRLARKASEKIINASDAARPRRMSKYLNVET